jgi:hypothetical protein
MSNNYLPILAYKGSAEHAGSGISLWLAGVGSMKTFNEVPQ